MSNEENEKDPTAEGSAEASPEAKPRVRRVVRSAATRAAEAAQAAADAEAASASAAAAPEAAPEVAPVEAMPAQPAAASPPRARVSDDDEPGADEPAAPDALFARPRRAPLPPSPVRTAPSAPKFDFRSERGPADARPPRVGGGPGFGAPGRGPRPPRGPRPERPEGAAGEAARGLVRGGTTGDGRPLGPRPERADRGPRPERTDRGPRPERTDRGPRPERTDRGPRTERTDRGPRPGADAGARAPREQAQAPKAAAPPPPPSSHAATKPVNKPGPLHIPHAKTAIVAKKPSLTPKEALKAKLAKHGKADVAKKPEVSAAPAAAPTSVTFDAAQLEASWEAARAAVEAAGAAAGQLVDAWTKANNAAAVAALAADEAAPGAARRAAKRGLAVLRSRGVTIPSAPKREQRGEASGPAIEVTMRAPDGSGTRGFVFSQREPDGRFRIAEVIVQDGLGVVYAGAGWLSASGLKEAGKRVQQNRGAAPVAVPVPWARHEIAEAKKQNASSSQPLPLELARCKELVEPPPGEAPQHPLAELESTIDDAQATAMAATSMLLYQEPELGSWVAERRAVDDMLQQLGQRLGAEGANDPQKAGELLREEVLAAVDRFFASEARDRVVDRLRDVALSIRARKGDEAAKTVLGVAKAVKSAGLITQPPRDIPFLVGLFDRAVSVLAQNGQLRIPSPRTA